jgi:hypothetical protein
MAEEEKAPSATGSENLIQISKEFADMVSAATSRRRTNAQEPDVEGHAMSVEEFSAGGRSGDLVCGVVYSSN